MKLPPSLRFPKPGFWLLHALLIPGVFGGGVALGIFHATGHGEGHDHTSTRSSSTAPTGAPEDAIQDEMKALQAAYDQLGRAAVLGDPAGVVEAFHAVHARKDATEAALASGAARPPRNADHLDAFRARDEAFHAQIEAVVGAAQAGDVPSLRRLHGELRDGCVGCHEEFRGTP